MAERKWISYQCVSRQRRGKSGLGRESQRNLLDQGIETPCGTSQWTATQVSRVWAQP